MDTKIPKTLAIVMLVLLAATSGCATGAANTTSQGQAPRPTIGPGKLPAAPSVHEIAQTTTLAGTSVGPATAACPPGEVALGGGWELPAPATGGSIHPLRNDVVTVSLEGARVYKALLTGNTWAVYVSHSPLIVSKPLPVTAYVECLAGVPDAVVTQHMATRDLMPEQVEGLGPACATGQSAAGFGFDFSDSPANLELMGDYPGNVLGVVSWTIEGENHDSQAHSVSAYAQCLSSAKTSVTYPPPLSGPRVSGGTAVDLQQNCPGEQGVAGGGIAYHYSILGAGNMYRQHASSSGWQGSLYASKGSSSLDDKVFLACLSFS